MGWTLPHTIGNLHLLWYWALDFAPTGDLTRFDPDQLTHDLDLDGATPEQFIEAMVESGFIDRTEEGSRRLHDWPEYTAKSLRPRFRRNPERWHQVLRSYGLPVITRRSSTRRTEKVMVEHIPQGAVRVDCDERLSSPSRHGGNGSVASNERNQSEDAEGALRADPNVSQNDGAAQPAQQTESNTTRPPALDLPTEQQRADLRRIRGEVPRTLSLVPGFVDTWWLRLLEMYKNRGTPLDPNQRRELLARLCFRPNSSVKLLKHCVENELDCKWENFPNTS
jgi:hypothetical protein